MSNDDNRKVSSLLPGVTLHLPPIPTEFIEITYKCGENQDNFNVPATKPTLPFASSELKDLPIKEARCLTSANDVKSVIEISLDNKDALLEFKAGDTIGILPQNPADEVDFLITHLDLTRDSRKQYLITLKDVSTKKKPAIPPHVPVNSTIEYVLQKCIDIRSVLKKIFICALSIYTEDATEKRCLEEISSREGAHLYTEQILNKNTSILDILRVYPSCKPPITLLLQYLPRLMPRPYSICNSPLCTKDTIKICFSVASIKDGKKGIATGWLEDIVKRIHFFGNLNGNNYKDAILGNGLNCDKDDKITDLINDKLANLNINKSDCNGCLNRNINNLVSAYLRKSNTFCLPKDPSVPIIMIGIGTGLAPFIGFLEERQQLKINDAQISFGTAWLYFGCRYSDRDFLFKDELDVFVSDETLSKLVVSHSREDNFKFKYVQNALILDSKNLVNMIFEENAVVYICGDIHKIRKDITECLTSCFVKEKDISVGDADILLKRLKTSNQLIQDIWS